jgi:KaiC/GvpD/RAD55 family RecA-like ATPase
MSQFIKHTSCNECGSKDNFALYRDDDGYESGHCFGCQFTIPSKEYIEENPSKGRPKAPSRVKSTVAPNTKDTMEKQEKLKEIVSAEQTAELKARTTSKGGGYRGIRDDVYQSFGVRLEYDDNAEVQAVYYPCTEGGELTGWKPRVHPKQFGGSIGRTGASCDMFGQFKYKQPAKVCLIVGGEHDQLAAYQMLKDYYKSKNWEFEPVVVSPTVGETSSPKQLAKNYAFFDQFDKIILGYDNDEAGIRAAEKAVSALPKGKVFIAKWALKDPNEMLEKGRDRQFISDYYSAKTFVPVGVLPSSELYDRILQQSAVLKVPFPDFMGKLNELFVGGLSLGHIINIAADTGVGKTTLVNELIYYWIFNSPHTIGIVSMELDAGQYGEVLLSRHLSRKLSLIANIDDKLALLRSDTIKARSDELMMTADGNSRFYLLDNRDGTIEEIQSTIEELVVACGAKVIVLDPLQDVLDGLSNDEQAVFMKWAKGFIKSHGVLFVFINHMRKTPSGQNGADSEQNIMGSSTIIKSASANILLKRDKMAESEIVRNSTEISVPKNRICGLTGPAGAVYYDNSTHTLHNLDTWLDEHA